MIQLAMNYMPESKAVMPEEGTQNRTILDALKRGEYLSAMDSLTKYGVFRLAARVNDLRGMGWKILSQSKTLGSGKTVAIYSLNETQL